MNSFHLLKTFFFASIVICSCESKHSDKVGKQKAFMNIFDSLIYDSVVAYDYNGRNGREIINSKGQLSDKINKRIILSESQINKISTIFCNPLTYNGPLAACFDPHFGIVFYKSNKPISFVSICLACNYLVSSQEIKNMEGGFSDTGRINIRSFMQEIKFPNGSIRPF